MFWFYVGGSVFAVVLALMEFVIAVCRHHAKVKVRYADRHTVAV
jgi:hypothetical protein